MHCRTEVSYPPGIHQLRRAPLIPVVARIVYGVVIDDRTGRADTEATEAERAGQLAARKERGVPYDEFEAEWSKRKPPEEILYGPTQLANALRDLIQAIDPVRLDEPAVVRGVALTPGPLARDTDIAVLRDWVTAVRG